MIGLVRPAQVGLMWASHKGLHWQEPWHTACGLHVCSIMVLSKINHC